MGVKLNYENSPLRRETIEEILTNGKSGSYPDPKEYMSPEQIDEHIKRFENKCSIIMRISDYKNHVEGKTYIGRVEDNSQYIAPQDVINKAIEKSDGDMKMLFSSIGWDPEKYNGVKMVRIDIENINDLNPRIPSGNEMGANEYFLPGGFTNGGIPELVVDVIPNTAHYVKKITLL